MARYHAEWGNVARTVSIAALALVCLATLIGVVVHSRFSKANNSFDHAHNQCFSGSRGGTILLTEVVHVHASICKLVSRISADYENARLGDLTTQHKTRLYDNDTAYAT